MIEASLSQYIKAHRTDFDAVIFDIDGTLSMGKVPIPGASELLAELNESDTPYLLLTNDAGSSVEQKAGYLFEAGIPVAPGHLLSSGNALKLWAKENYHGGKFFQMGKLGTPSFAELAGIPCTSDIEEIFECCGVICGGGIYDWQNAIIASLNLLSEHPEYPLVVCNPDSLWVSTRKLRMGVCPGGVARFVCQLLADAGKTVEPVYLGKPHAPIYKCAAPYLRSLYPEKNFSDPARLLMVGDSLNSDVAGANENGMTSALLLTGLTTREMAAEATGKNKPDLIFQNI